MYGLAFERGKYIMILSHTTGRPITDAAFVCVMAAIIAEQLLTRHKSARTTLLNTIRVGGFVLAIIGLVVGGIWRL